MAKLIIQNRYGIVPNDILNSDKISFKAKGLFAYIQSKPDTWDFSAERICNQTREGLHSVKMALRELEGVGLLRRVKTKNEKGHFEVDYVLYDKIGVENPSVGNPPSGIPLTDNHTNNSNNDLSKKELRKKDIIPFSFFWDLYDKKVGHNEKLQKKWEALTDEEREKAIQHIQKYKLATPDKQYRKNPETYLNNKSFNDEIVGIKEVPILSDEPNAVELNKIMEQYNIQLPEHIENKHWYVKVDYVRQILAVKTKSNALNFG